MSRHVTTFVCQPSALDRDPDRFYCLGDVFAGYLNYDYSPGAFVAGRGHAADLKRPLIRRQYPVYRHRLAGPPRRSFGPQRRDEPPTHTLLCPRSMFKREKVELVLAQPSDASLAHKADNL